MHHEVVQSQNSDRTNCRTPETDLPAMFLGLRSKITREIPAGSWGEWLIPFPSRLATAADAVVVIGSHSAGHVPTPPRLGYNRRYGSKAEETRRPPALACSQIATVLDYWERGRACGGISDEFWTSNLADGSRILQRVGSSIVLHAPAHVVGGGGIVGERCRMVGFARRSR